MKQTTKIMQQQFDKMCQTENLYVSSVDGNKIWETYIKSFENDPVFRDPNSSTHNCNLCNNFLRRYGNIIAVDKNNKIMTMFDDLEDIENDMVPVFNSLSKLLRKSSISNIFVETFDELKNLPYEKTTKNQEVYQLGVAQNFKQYDKAEAGVYGVVKEGEIYEFNHLNVKVSKEFIDFSGKSKEAIQALYRTSKELLERGLNEIKIDTLDLVIDLINQNSLLDGSAHLPKVKEFKKIVILFNKQKFSNDLEKECWLWNASKSSISRFRNSLIGVLCTELSEGEELNKACENWNKRVDPANYMKATAPITKSQIENAEKFVIENGYVESFDRRFATIDDIKASEILHLNISDEKIAPVSVFSGMKSKSTSHKRSNFDKLESVSIEKFMKEIVPTCSSIEVFFENKHQNNLVVMTTANVKESKPIFKWPNNYSWTYKGNLAGVSQIKEAVKSKGGKVDGVLRFSIMWADGDGDNSDLDAHCIEPNKNRIYFSNKYSRTTRGNLDIDIMQPHGILAVENITYPSKENMIIGRYKFMVNQYNARQSKGFKAEIEINGQIYEYSYPRSVSGTIDVAEVNFDGTNFEINHKLESTSVSKEMYGIQTQEFHKVELLCLSPNHWSDNPVGNKHYFFMVEKAKCNEKIRSFHVENLKQDLLEHRKVMEVLGNTTMIDTNQKHLAGLGFNATVKDEIIVKCKGSFSRMLKVIIN